MTKEEFIVKAKLVQDKEYDYSKVEYKGNKTKVCIICPKHGEFWIRPNDFLSGHMCGKCGIETRSKKKLISQEHFIEKAKTIFPQYDYSLVNYIGMHTKIKLICPIHGKFEIKPYHLLNGHGCKKCGQISSHNKQRKTKEIFIAEAIKIHDNKYDYSKVKYINRDTNVCIICPKHGEFLQTPHHHLRGCGCPICSESSLEKEIRVFLDKLSINYIHKKTFDWLGQQHLDFYLPEYNAAIECQGIQHFEVVDFFGGEKGLEKRIERDKKKKILCEKNNIFLLYYSTFEYDGVYTNKDLLINEIKRH